MGANPIGPEVVQFIVHHLRSVEQVEILSLLAGDPAKIWTAHEVYRAIQSTEDSVAKSLRAFVDANLAVEKPGAGFCFTAATNPMRDMALAVVKTYRERPVAVIETIYSRENKAAQSFADAFRLRKGK